MKEIKSEKYTKSKLKDFGVPEEYSELLSRMLKYNTKDRPSLEEILKHKLIDISDGNNRKVKLSKKRIEKLEKHVNMSKFKKLIHE